MTPMSGAANVRGRGVATAVLVAALSVGAVAACSSSSPSASTKRPTTNARLEIVSPPPNAIVGSTTKLVFKLIGGRVVPATSKALRGDEGHIHVSVDGKIVSMAYGTSQTVTGLAAGDHTLSAEFVAADHIPFANPQNVLVRELVTVKK